MTLRDSNVKRRHFACALVERAFATSYVIDVVAAVQRRATIQQQTDDGGQALFRSVAQRASVAHVASEFDEQVEHAQRCVVVVGHDERVKERRHFQLKLVDNQPNRVAILLR